MQLPAARQRHRAKSVGRSPSCSSASRQPLGRSVGDSRLAEREHRRATIARRSRDESHLRRRRHAIGRRCATTIRGTASDGPRSATDAHLAAASGMPATRIIAAICNIWLQSKLASGGLRIQREEEVMDWFQRAKRALMQRSAFLVATLEAGGRQRRDAGCAFEPLEPRLTMAARRAWARWIRRRPIAGRSTARSSSPPAATAGSGTPRLAATPPTAATTTRSSKTSATRTR